jgi:hypothetical protein
MIEKIPVSYSRIKMFEECPKKFQEVTLLKRYKTAQSEPQIRGERIHRHLENALKGGHIDREIEHMTPIIEKLNGISWDHKLVEHEIVYGHNFEKRSWFDKDVRWRIKIDFAGIKDGLAIIYDWKTGKTPSEQLPLYSAAIMKDFPEVNECDAKFIFVDQKKTEGKRYGRADCDFIWQEYLERAESIQIANESNIWPTTPSHFVCRWCPVADCEERV